MKVVIYKFALFIAAISSIISMRKSNLRSATGTESLTFYQMALHAHGHDQGQMLVMSEMKNPTNISAVGALKTQEEITVDKPPYEISRCDQVMMLEAQRILNFEDYTTRAPAFFTLSAYILNMFESKDNNKLLESINLGHIKKIPSFLMGSKDCVIFLDDISKRNITLCTDDFEIIDAVDRAYSDFMSCREGDDLKAFDPVTINNVLTASCNGFNNTSGVEYDMPAIRAKMADELRQSGFEVTDTSTSGNSEFGLGNATSTDSPVPTPSRKIDLRVPGTY